MLTQAVEVTVNLLLSVVAGNKYQIDVIAACYTHAASFCNTSEEFGIYPLVSAFSWLILNSQIKILEQYIQS